MTGARRWLPLAVIGLLVVTGLVWMFGGGGNEKTVTAYFPRAVSVYEGSEVRILGIPVGRVREVVPAGTKVKVVMAYDSDIKVPADADASSCRRRWSATATSSSRRPSRTVTR